MLADTLRGGRTAAFSVSLEELIPENHPIRKLDAAIDWERRCAPMRACYSAGRGRPAFEPEVLLAVALLRHIYHVDSLRAISAELQTNLVFRWFAGCPLGENAPHFSTISANLLHRIPKDVFENAFAGALCNILDAGVMQPEELIYESSSLTREGQLDALTQRYLPLCEQLCLSLGDDVSECGGEAPEPEQLPIPL